MNFSRNCILVMLAALLAALGVRAQQHEIEHATLSIVPSFVPSVPWKRQLSSPRTRAHGLPTGSSRRPQGAHELHGHTKSGRGTALRLHSRDRVSPRAPPRTQ